MFDVKSPQMLTIIFKSNMTLNILRRIHGIRG